MRKKVRPVVKMCKPMTLAGWQVLYRQNLDYNYISLTMFLTYEEAEVYVNQIQESMMDYNFFITPLFVESYF